MVLFSVESEPIPVEFFIGKLSLFDDLFDFLFGQAEEHVFGFEIGVDDSANSIQKVEAHEDLSGNLFDEVEGESFVVVPFEDFEQVDSEYLEDHAEVVSVGSLIEEGVE